MRGGAGPLADDRERGQRVFVYGTLMPGGSNAAVVRRAGLRAWEPAELPDFVIYHLEPEGYPAVVPGAGRVHGTLLWLDGPLAPLDELEGLALDPPLYRRERHPLHDGRSAWVYVYNRPQRLRSGGAVPLPDGRWRPTGRRP